MKYNPDNIFARLLREELPCRKVCEGPHYLAFHDLHPQAPVHVLVIPRGPYSNATVFHEQALSEEILGFYQGLADTIKFLSLKKGYRLISNTGPDANQEVSHFHVHILAGKPLGPLLAGVDSSC